MAWRMAVAFAERESYAARIAELTSERDTLVAQRDRAVSARDEAVAAHDRVDDYHTAGECVKSIPHAV